jgi:predicted regulator of Ras-like GTPase activity (Roadblock/LC7/MglB family)
MSFESVLGSIVHECGGGLSIALVGNDGIAIVQVHEVPIERNPLGGDLSIAGAEFGRILNEIHKASDALAGGEVNEVVVALSRFTLVFEEVDEDVVMVLALAPEGNLGKARYLMRRHVREIREEL